jgi:hypothetical protein
VTEWEIPGLNHFTIIDELTREDSALFKRVASRLRGWILVTAFWQNAFAHLGLGA